MCHAVGKTSDRQTVTPKQTSPWNLQTVVSPVDIDAFERILHQAWALQFSETTTAG